MSVTRTSTQYELPWGIGKQATPTTSLSSALRLSAREAKATNRPSAEIEGSREPRSAGAPDAAFARLTRVVVFLCRSRTKVPATDSALRLWASDWKATKRPSAEIEGVSE